MQIATMSMKEPLLKRYGLMLAFLALLIIIALPVPEGLPVTGQRMLGILMFSIIVWMYLV